MSRQSTEALLHALTRKITWGGSLLIVLAAVTLLAVWGLHLALP